MPARSFTPEHAAVKNMLEKAVGDRVFPGAATMWGQPGQGPPNVAWAGLRGYSRNLEPVDEKLVYDLASVTKVAATTSLMMIFCQKGLIDLKEPLASGPLNEKNFWPKPWHGLTALHLLSHQSGLTAWRPFYRLPVNDKKERRAAVIKAILNEAPQTPLGERVIYSDLNFLLLGFLLECLSGGNIAELFKEEVAKPLKLDSLGYRPVLKDLAPTEDGFRVGGPLADEQAAILGAVPLGRAHDDNAAFLGGMAGHAGLFGRAGDLWILAAEWVKTFETGASRLFTKKTLDVFRRPRATSSGEPGRPLGFDCKTPGGILEDTGFSGETVGHLGYTGTSMWWDPTDGFVWILLSNRVHPSARNQKINLFRRELASFLRPKAAAL